MSATNQYENDITIIHSSRERSPSVDRARLKWQYARRNGVKLNCNIVAVAEDLRISGSRTAALSG